jgi:hypothetical protein
MLALIAVTPPASTPRSNSPASSSQLENPFVLFADSTSLFKAMPPTNRRSDALIAFLTDILQEFLVFEALGMHETGYLLYTECRPKRQTKILGYSSTQFL